MKWTTILGLVILSLLATVLHRLATRSRSQVKSVPAESHRISKTARVSKAPKSHSIHAGRLANGETETEPDGQSEDIEQIVQSVSDAELPALCDSLVRDVSQEAADLTQVALGWAGTDLTAALDWARTLPEDNGQEAVTLYLAYEAARTILSRPWNRRVLLSRPVSATTCSCMPSANGPPLISLLPSNGRIGTC